MCWLKKDLNCELRSQSSSGNDGCSKSGGGCNNICGCKNNSSSNLIFILIEAAIVTVINVVVVSSDSRNRSHTNCGKSHGLKADIFLSA